ncbi:MAG: hypothetical protein NZ767_01795 [SAR86 cluster bacterium]|nr:hypothetical protein [SAR86 cluster bacterium]
MLEKVENFYLNFFRYFLIFFASISLIVGLINLLISFSMIMTKPDLVEEANLPNWSSIKYQVLPLVNPMTKLEEGKASISSESKENKENNELKVIDIKLKKIARNLDKLFAENDSKFSTQVSYEDFQKWTIPSGLEGQDLEKFLEGIIIFSQDMSVEPRILAMYDPTGKLELIQSSLEIYMDSFMEEQEKTERENSKRISLAEGRSLLGYSQLQYSLYACLAFVLVLVIVLVFKVELNLRKIAPAINKRDLE